jgi:hypothetical protein
MYLTWTFPGLPLVPMTQALNQGCSQFHSETVSHIAPSVKTLIPNGRWRLPEAAQKPAGT